MVIPPLVKPLEKSITPKEVKIPEKEIPHVISPPEEIKTVVTLEITESNAKKLIIAHKYKDAIEILRALNLNNPKKSVYFADQIRFLEKVIANSKK